MASRTEQTIAVVIWDGVEELDAVGPYEVLAAWARMSDRPLRVVTVAQEAQRVSGSHGLGMVPDVTWKELGRPDVLVLPGGASKVQLTDESFLARLRDLSGGGTLMTSVCTGALVFAAAGFLDGRPATTWYGALELLPTLGTSI
jgi:transcriptional regulator GlxA family with amidase domain